MFHAGLPRISQRDNPSGFENWPEHIFRDWQMVCGRTALVVSARFPCLAVLVCSSLLTVACSTFSPRVSNDDLQKSRNVLVWSTDRKLTWADYLAQPPAGEAGEVAISALSLVWGFRCRGDVLDFQTVAAFYRDGSWVKGALLREPDRGRGVLAHEQTHFDLTELYARMMRRFFGTLNRPCDRSPLELTALGNQFVRYEGDAQREYDDESAHGKQPAIQSEWEENVESALSALHTYAPDATTWSGGGESPRP